MHILIIEDDKDLCSILKKELEKENFLCDICNNGDKAMYYILNKNYDIIILDRMLPEKNGLTILKEIRTNSILCPVIMVTAMNTIENKIEGLDNGADDYLVKPFAMEELFARIKAVSRRPSIIINNTLLTFSDIKLDMDKISLSSNSKTCPLNLILRLYHLIEVCTDYFSLSTPFLFIR